MIQYSKKYGGIMLLKINSYDKTVKTTKNGNKIGGHQREIGLNILSSAFPFF